MNVAEIPVCAFFLSWAYTEHDLRVIVIVDKLRAISAQKIRQEADISPSDSLSSQCGIN